MLLVLHSHPLRQSFPLPTPHLASTHLLFCLHLSRSWFLDRMATHILAFEDNSTAVWFEGNFSEYEEDRRRRTGQIAPTRIKFRRLANV